MGGFIFIGILLGVVFSSAQRIFATKELLGFSILGIGGALYGNLIATMISGYVSEPTPYLSPLLIVSMSLLFMGIKVVLLKRHREITSH